ncbi:MAG TPA: hypothetical protein VF868_03195 [Bacteroidia bacterium]|jgi:hypothetical protein
MEEKQKLELIAQKLDNKKKRLEIIEAEKELQMSDKKMVLEQINNLRNLITETILDPEQTVFASEKKYRLVFDEQEINKLKKKIWDLLG